MHKLQNRFHELFAYANGKIIRKTTVGNTKAGSIVNYKEPNGYLRVRVDGKRYTVHQVVFCMQYGYIPKMLDHINCIKDDNRIENLREATKFENGYNTKTPITNTTGTKNIQWIKHMNKFQVRLKVKKQNKVIGYFSDMDLAQLVADEARNKYHGAFTNHGNKEQLNGS
jgi:hypothetical protein